MRFRRRLRPGPARPRQTNASDAGSGTEDDGSNWPRISPPYQTNAVQAWIVVPAPVGDGFYRLHKP